MTTSKNDITGDLIKTKSVSKKYVDNYDAIFRNADKKENKNNNENSDIIIDTPSD